MLSQCLTGNIYNIKLKSSQKCLIKSHCLTNAGISSEVVLMNVLLGQYWAPIKPMGLLRSFEAAVSATIIYLSMLCNSVKY